MPTPEAWLKDQLPLAPLLQKRGSPGEVPQAWELLSSLGEREEEDSSRLTVHILPWDRAEPELKDRPTRQ